MLWALLPSGFLFLLDASAVVLLLPLLGLYASDPMINYYFYHHYIITVPIVVYGTIRAFNHPLLHLWAAALVPVLVIWAVVLDISYSSVPLNLMHFIHQPSLLATTKRNAAQEAMVKAIPLNAVVDADYALAAHLATRTICFNCRIRARLRKRSTFFLICTLTW